LIDKLKTVAAFVFLATAFVLWLITWPFAAVNHFASRAFDAS
jgi:hypothetical protein